MAEERIFVGRKDELEKFGKILEEAKGQAVLVVGQAGMGKTWLINKMAEVAENHPELKCGWVRYEVTPTDSVDSTMALMMDEGFEAAASKIKKGIRLGGRSKQWSALLSAVGLIPVVGDKAKTIGELVMSLRREPTKDTRKQFIEKLNYISETIPENGRAVFIIDPEKYMQKESDQSWAIVVKQLPEKIKFVFAQRPEDVLVDSETFDALDNVVRVPGERLGVLEEEAVDELLTLRGKGLKFTVSEVRKVLSRYEGHPYALGAALDLIKGGIKLEELPEKPEPTKFAAVQWKEVSNRSEDAIRLFKGYAILEVGVPDGVVEAVGEIDSDKQQHLMADKYLRGLLREEGEGRRIYHAILAHHIVDQIGEAEKKEYHSRAVKVYGEKLAVAKKAQTKPDALSARRLFSHVEAMKLRHMATLLYLRDWFEPLFSLGMLDAATGFSERALNFVEKGSKEESIVLGNLGLIYQVRGEPDKAEEMHIKALEIDEKLGLKEGMASDYGNLGLIYERRGDLDKAEKVYKKSLEISEPAGMMELTANQYGNLGNVYQTRGDLDKAEEMHKKSLEIDEKLGLKEGMASNYGNLGLIYYTRGDLDKAEEMQNKALEIDKKLGRLEGMAAEYGNLGVVYEERGDVAKAREFWEKALELYKKIGMPHRVEEVERWIRGLKKS